MLLKLIALILALFSYLYIAKSSFASIKFQDDFSSYSDGQFPSLNWVFIQNPYDPVCNAQWFVENGVLKARLPNHSPCAENITPTDGAWGTLIDNYTMEADVRFISGTDHNLTFRIAPDGINNNEMHFAVPGGGFSLGVYPPVVQTVFQSDKYYVFNEDYHIKVVINGVDLRFYSNGDLTREVILENPLLLGKVALRIGTGDGSVTETWFDNVKVTTLDDNTLAVPLLKQTDSHWGADLYDSANLWSTGATDISRWGCALTSAAMVFRFNGLTKMQDGITELNPGSLNKWLQDVKDGSFRNGATSWWALQRLSRLLKTVNNVAFDALEFKKITHQDNAVLNNYLQQNIPAILETPGHFIVATGADTENNSYFINDPFYPRTTLSSYGDAYTTLGAFVPSHTDLSSLVFVVDPSVSILLTDNSGQQKGDVYLQNPIVDPLGQLSNSVGPLKVLYFNQPPDGDYSIEVSSNNSQQYVLDSYLYDKNGEIKMITNRGYVGMGNSDIYDVHQNSDNVSSSIFTQENPTFDSLIGDITSLYQLGKITKKGSYNYLINKISQAQSYSISDPVRAADILNFVKNQLIDDKKKGVDAEASGFIIGQIDLLLTTL